MGHTFRWGGWVYFFGKMALLGGQRVSFHHAATGAYEGGYPLNNGADSGGGYNIKRGGVSFHPKMSPFFVGGWGRWFWVWFPCTSTPTPALCGALTD